MPIPKPRKGEDNKSFTERCHRALNKEYPDQKQRHAICQDSWRKGTRSEDLSYSHIIDFLNESHWAITPEALDNMHQILAHRLSDGKATVEEIEIKIGENKDRPNAPYMVGSTAVIPVFGPIAKKANLFTMISGGTSAELLQRDIQEAMEDKKVKEVLFDIDSPGGSVDGPFDVADVIYQYRGVKPMRAFANGQMTSAAYLIGSAADEVVASKTARVGSIGVITAHYDYSKAQEMQGVKKTYLYSGKYKAMGHDSEPLTDEAREYIQERLDHFYTMFVDAVARNRGVDKSEVLSKMADGKIFIGKQAMERGLVDKLGTFGDAMMFEICEKKEVKEKMNPNEYKTEHPQEYQKLVDQVTQEVKTEMQVEIKEKDKMIATLTEQNKDLSASLEETNTRLLSLEKKDAMRTEREMKRDADSIWGEELIASDIPARLHPKVRSMVRHEKFIKDGEFDRDGFREAVRTEMKEWEGIGTETVIGGGAPLVGEGGNTEQTEEQESEALVDEMLEMAGDKPATQH